MQCTSCTTWSTRYAYRMQQLRKQPSRPKMCRRSPIFLQRMPKIQRRERIISIKYTVNISCTEARKRIQSKPVTYASIATKHTQEIGTQTYFPAQPFTKPNATPQSTPTLDETTSFLCCKNDMVCDCRSQQWRLIVSCGVMWTLLQVFWNCFCASCLVVSSHQVCSAAPVLCCRVYCCGASLPLPPLKEVMFSSEFVCFFC